MKKNKQRKKELETKYGKCCMLTGVKQDLTYHHIDKVADGGPTTLDNGSVLSAISQDWLHNLIELHNPTLYDLINECILLYKKVMDLGEQTLIDEYKQNIIPKYIEHIVEYDKKHMNKNTKVLIKRSDYCE